MTEGELERLRGLVESLTAANRENRILLDTQGAEVERLREEKAQADAAYRNQALLASKYEARLHRIEEALRDVLDSGEPNWEEARAALEEES